MALFLNGCIAVLLIVGVLVLFEVSLLKGGSDKLLNYCVGCAD
jgi:hypothetical protein